MSGRRGGSRLGQGIDWMVARKVHAINREVDFTELREICGELPKATLSRCLRRLEAAGVVVIRADSGDGRRRLIRRGSTPADSLSVPNLATHLAHATGAEVTP